MKKILTLLGLAFLCMLVIFPVAVNAETFGDYDYTDLDDGTDIWPG